VKSYKVEGVEKLQNIFLDKKNLARTGAMVLFVVAVAAVVLFNPFKREQEQLQDLRVIADSEKGADSLSSQFGDFVERERSLRQVIAASPSPAAGVENNPRTGYTAFDAVLIASEAQNVSVLSGIHTENERKTDQVFEEFAYFYTNLYAN
jgi:hypothetical protein